VAILGIAVVGTVNVYLNDKGSNLNQTLLSNIEALASCESSVSTGLGGVSSLNCKNSQGETGNIPACDFNMSYNTTCTGRSYW
jgi:hypothetical protein